MNKTSCNVIFVYSLLLVDLLVNITDNLLSPANQPKDASNNTVGQPKTISDIVFVIIMVQILAIVIVILDLIFHFFQISDRVMEYAFMEAKNKSQNSRNPFQVRPMKQREAMKLVLDKYWWSLLVGMFYLVLTIMLQIVKFDPIWHAKPTMANGNSRHFDELRMEIKDMVMEPNSLTLIKSEPETTNLVLSEQNLLPIILLLIHKLVSTCYYVSFVVVYRATPNQMINRIFGINNNNNSGHQSRVT